MILPGLVAQRCNRPLQLPWRISCITPCESIPVLQAERLEELQETLSIPFDGSDPSHQDQLRELWALAFPGVPCGALKTPRWKDMGWQVGML